MKSEGASLTEVEIKRKIEELVTKYPDGIWLEQDHAARRLGYQNYEHYRQSSLWRSIRKRVLKRDGKICSSCFAPAKDVHHRSYADDVMRGENDAFLVSVCKACHHLIHYDGKRWRETWEERDAILFNG